MDAEAGSVMVTFLHPYLPAPSLTFPEPPHMVDVDISAAVLQNAKVRSLLSTAEEGQNLGRS